MQRRLATINTARPSPRRGSPPVPPPPPPSQVALPAGPGGVAAISQALEQDWMAALTPDSSELQAAAAAAAPPRPAAPGPAAAKKPAHAAAPADPFAAVAHVSFDVPEAAAGTLPRGGGLHRAASGAPAAAAPPPLALAAAGRQGSCAMLRQGSASIDIPYHRMKRAETAPALTDDLIAAAAAAASSNGSGSSGGLAKAAATRAAAAAMAAAAAAASGNGGSGHTRSAGSSYRGSPPKLATLPERAASATREVFNAQAEAVAALTQAKVLQQALAQVRGRGWRLEVDVWVHCRVPVARAVFG